MEGGKSFAKKIIALVQAIVAFFGYFALSYAFKPLGEWFRRPDFPIGSTAALIICLILFIGIMCALSSWAGRKEQHGIIIGIMAAAVAYLIAFGWIHTGGTPAPPYVRFVFDTFTLPFSVLVWILPGWARMGGFYSTVLPILHFAPHALYGFVYIFDHRNVYEFRIVR
jgi:hypothetical protein